MLQFGVRTVASLRASVSATRDEKALILWAKPVTALWFNLPLLSVVKIGPSFLFYKELFSITHQSLSTFVNKTRQRIDPEIGPKFVNPICSVLQMLAWEWVCSGGGVGGWQRVYVQSISFGLLTQIIPPNDSTHFKQSVIVL